jgi:hypothetical protein
MSRSASEPTIPPVAFSAWLTLTRAIARLEATGRRPLCRQHPDQWDADATPSTRAEAAKACDFCPLLQPCATYADLAAETFHVWGGRDRGKPDYEPPKGPA